MPPAFLFDTPISPVTTQGRTELEIGKALVRIAPVESTWDCEQLDSPDVGKIRKKGDPNESKCAEHRPKQGCSKTEKATSSGTNTLRMEGEIPSADS